MTDVTNVDLIFLKDYEYALDDFNILNKKNEVYYLKDIMFNDWDENVINTNYTKTFNIEGRSDNNNEEYILLYDNRFRRYSNESKLILNDLNFDTKVSIFYNGYIIDLQDDIDYGELYGQVNLINCGINDITNVEILCFRNDDKRFIGRYNLDGNRYTIPNLHADVRYDIVLVDKSRTIEQQVSSYRLPTRYQK